MGAGTGGLLGPLAQLVAGLVMVRATEQVLGCKADRQRHEVVAALHCKAPTLSRTSCGLHAACERMCVSSCAITRRLLKDRNGSSAMVRFEKALMLAKSLNERVYERRSMRGLAAAARLQAKPPPNFFCSLHGHKHMFVSGMGSAAGWCLQLGALSCTPCRSSASRAGRWLQHGARLHAGKSWWCCLQGQLPAAVSHLERVLEISGEIGDHVGDADAHGTIADIYTDMGLFDKAAKSYDRYINLMSRDGPV